MRALTLSQTSVKTELQQRPRLILPPLTETLHRSARRTEAVNPDDAEHEDCNEDDDYTNEEDQTVSRQLRQDDAGDE